MSATKSQDSTKTILRNKMSMDSIPCIVMKKGGLDAAWVGGRAEAGEQETKLKTQLTKMNDKMKSYSSEESVFK